MFAETRARKRPNFGSAFGWRMPKAHLDFKTAENVSQVLKTPTNTQIQIAIKARYVCLRTRKARAEDFQRKFGHSRFSTPPQRRYLVFDTKLNRETNPVYTLTFMKVCFVSQYFMKLLNATHSHPCTVWVEVGGVSPPLLRNFRT